MKSFISPIASPKQSYIIGKVEILDIFWPNSSNFPKFRNKSQLLVITIDSFAHAVVDRFCKNVRCRSFALHHLS